jgi:hypothetical protein
MNAIAGKNNWYIAGGCAAWLHIESYPNKDAAHYAAVRSHIVPGDVEIGMLNESARKVAVKFGTKMYVTIENQLKDVDVQEQSPEILAAHRSCCVTFMIENEPILIYSRQNIISAYTMGGGDESKAEKRKLRVSILTMMNQGVQIAPSVSAVSRPITIFEEMTTHPPKLRSTKKPED